MGTKNSTLVANFEAVPSVANATQELEGRVRIAQGTVALATGDLDLNDVIMLAPLPSNAVIHSIRFAADDLDSASPATLTWNLGLHETDGTAADADCYATAITLGQAATVFTEYRFEAANITTVGNKLWEDAGLTADPGGQYYLSLTVAAAPTAVAGDLSFIVEYTVD